MWSLSGSICICSMSFLTCAIKHEIYKYDVCKYIIKGRHACHILQLLVFEVKPVCKCVPDLQVDWGWLLRFTHLPSKTELTPNSVFKIRLAFFMN